MINKDFFQALEDLEVEKNIDKGTFIEALENAMTSAYKKMYGEGKSARVMLNPERNLIRIFSYKTIVEEVEDEDKEISLQEAQLIKKSYKIGDTVEREESTKEFGRIAAQTAKQVVMQKIKEKEREIALSEVSEKEDELITGIVKRNDNGTVYVNIANTSVEGIMLPTDQIPKERYAIGQRLKVYVKKIKDSFRGPQIQVTRTNIGFLRKIFELEVPEIASGEVKIKNISREPGNRAKVAVFTENKSIDPIGTCVGNHGVRINTIITELNGEKIDLIPYSEDPLDFIASALAPARVLSVETNESLNASRVIVPDDQLSLAIGKQGLNVRLASKLVGWKIDVKSESSVNAEQNVEEEYEISEVNDSLEEENFQNFESFEEINGDNDEQ